MKSHLDGKCDYHRGRSQWDPARKAEFYLVAGRLSDMALRERMLCGDCYLVILGEGSIGDNLEAFRFDEFMTIPIEDAREKLSPLGN